MVLRAAGLGLLAGAAAAFVAEWLRPRTYHDAGYAAPRPGTPEVDLRPLDSVVTRTTSRTGGP
ncbi:hypothetical protein [Angustibacter aerolatus]